GFRSDEAQEAIRVYYNNHEGMSIESESVRQVIYRCLERIMKDFKPDDYLEYFELTKTFAVYMDIFANQQFNQQLKELSMAFVHQCLKQFTDKRGKEYQDVKKFVSASFLEWNFLKEKEIVELFKTKRTRK
ncbi:hypothetical protein RZS08_25500, partial [Arthrospira platensis SPKY1]|nr:hypothetical protein [Arthrospira platensis SPKY1]